jgi:hypothetical protein
MKNTQNFKNIQNFEIELCGDEPMEHVSCWTRTFDFNLTIKENGTEKEYYGVYWWNSEGNEGISWYKQLKGEPSFGENKAEIINQIKAKVKKIIKELAEEEGKDDFWMIPE